MRRSVMGVAVLGSAIPVLGFGLVIVTMLSAASAAPGNSAPIASAGDIPAEYLRLYQAAAAEEKLGADGWSYLAGVGKVECDHGRSTAYGCDRGEVNSAGARGPAQFLDPTWAAYGVDGDGDGTRDVYVPADAIFGMANYLEASGAPGDWHRALFAYNHSDAYVADVMAWAERYRAGAETATAPTILAPAVGGQWLAPVPGFPGEQCDSRIVADVVAIVQRYGLFLSDCYGGEPHDINGEHPLGLAIDASPADGDWDRTLRLAIDAGWSPSCAAAGCPGRGPFRVVLYNGFPGHGDPSYTDIPHIHLSWEHAPAAPFSRTDWVQTLLPSPSPSAAHCPSGRKHNKRPRGAGRSCHA